MVIIGYVRSIQAIHVALKYVGFVEVKALPLISACVNEELIPWLGARILFGRPFSYILHAGDESSYSTWLTARIHDNVNYPDCNWFLYCHGTNVI